MLGVSLHGKKKITTAVSLSEDRGLSCINSVYGVGELALSEETPGLSHSGTSE